MDWIIAGHKVNLYGVIYGRNGDYVRLNRTVWEFEYDPDDGYRSYCSGITRLTLAEAKALDIGPFFPKPIATVLVRTAEDNDSSYVELIDVNDNHVWLMAGTFNTNDYYPYYSFHFQPKAPGQEPKDVEKREHWQ